MDFFEAQARAKKRTSRLVVLFVLAVLGIIAAGYFAFIFLTASVGVRATANGGGIERDPSGPGNIELWQPGALIAFSLLTIAVVGLSALGKWLQLRAGGRAVAKAVGAREVPLQTTGPRERQLLNIVEEMSIASGLPLPAVYVLDGEAGINAFAAGLTTSDAVVAVTRGTLEKLNRDELQGVVAHEFSHILNGDMRLNMRLTAVLYGILVVGLIGRGIVYSMQFSRPRRSSKEGNAVFVVIALGLVLLVLGYIGYFFGRLIQAAVSRQREFLADASAVQFTRNPAGIAGALKKIGGYAIGSNVRAAHASEFSHFFFAQGFRSSFGGLWATHPPLDERIRAVDASFDGKYHEPPEVVDVARESWQAGRPPPPRPAAPPALDPLLAVAAIGTLGAAQTAQAQHLAADIPGNLRDAAHSPEGAGAIACGLLLDTVPATRERQHDIIRRHADDAVASALGPIEDSLRHLPPAARLPLLLLTPPALRQLPRERLDALLGTLDELVHADARVSVFEFALQKVLTHHLALAANPAAHRETLSLPQVSGEISVLLTFAARLRPASDAAAVQAFRVGAARFAGLHPPLAFLTPESCTLDHLDAALDRLSHAYGPVKKRVLTAVAATLAHDGSVEMEEAELLRAFASALDCPMPPAI